MKCDVCKESIDERKFSIFATGENHVVICKKCMSKGMRGISGGVTGLVGKEITLQTTPTVFVLPRHTPPHFRAIAEEEGWTVTDLDVEGAVATDKHYEKALTHYRCGEAGWMRNPMRSQEDCFRLSCRELIEHWYLYWPDGKTLSNPNF